MALSSCGDIYIRTDKAGYFLLTLTCKDTHSHTHIRPRTRTLRCLIGLMPESGANSNYPRKHTHSHASHTHWPSLSLSLSLCLFVSPYLFLFLSLSLNLSAYLSLHPLTLSLSPNCEYIAHTKQTQGMYTVIFFNMANTTTNNDQRCFLLNKIKERNKLSNKTKNKVEVRRRER